MKTIHLLGAALTLLLLVPSCSKDELYQNPATSFTDETVLENLETVNTVLMGAYSWTGHFWYHTISQISLDVMGGDLTISDGSYGFSTYNWLMFAYNYIQYPRVVDGWWSAYAPYMWQRAYQAIDQCNELIANADQLPAGSEDVLAQAYGLRGWNFLNLYHLYCPAYTDKGDSGQGLFLRLTPGSADRNDVPRSDLGTSMKQILGDFTYAYDHCTAESREFIGKKAATLFLARTYLEMGDYANARKYAEELSSFDGKDLMTPEEYQAGFHTPNAEWIWGFNFTEETCNIYASIPSFYHSGTFKDKKPESRFGGSEYGARTTYEYLAENAVDWMTGYSTVRATFNFTALFGPNDCRALFPFYISEKDGMMISKYSSVETLGNADYPMARMAEAYLIEAEALLQTGDAARSLAVLNTLQNKRKGSLSPSSTIDEIWKERRRELYGEGFALTDIKRLGKPLERTGQDHWSSTKSLPANSPRMMYPIPQDELDHNSNTTAADQNEYWRQP